MINLLTTSSLATWLDMNGDGAYVWPCYLITLFVLIVNVWVARHRHRRLLSQAVDEQRQAAPRQPAHRVRGGAK